MLCCQSGGSGRSIASATPAQGCRQGGRRDFLRERQDGIARGQNMSMEVRVKAGRAGQEHEATGARATTVAVAAAHMAACCCQLL